MKVIVYTCNFDNYDTFRDVALESAASFIYFTDTNHKAKVWNIIPMDFKFHNKDPRKAFLYFKTNSHLVLPEHDFSIWINAQFDFKRNPLELISLLGDKDIVCFKHNKRTSLYQEAEVCSNLLLDNPETIRFQTDRYRKERFPDNYGLFYSGVIIRRNNEKVRRFNELWWDEIQKGSLRDQISQTYD